MTTTYLSRAAADRLDQAQAELDRHLPTGADGCCMTCRQFEPCPARSAAHATFARYGRLPRRRPGLTASATSAPIRWDAWSTKTPLDGR